MKRRLEDSKRAGFAEVLGSGSKEEKMWMMLAEEEERERGCNVTRVSGELAIGAVAKT